MNELVTQATLKAVDNVNCQYNTNGFGSGASGYIIIIFTVLCMIGMFAYIIKKDKEHKEDKNFDRTQYKEVLDKMMDSFLDTNKQIVDNIKHISDGQDKLVGSFNKSIEELYDVIGVQTKEFKKELNSDKELSLKEFERQYKVIAENCIYRIKDSLESRIEQNMLYENKETICGLGNSCSFENSEMFSLVKKFQAESREKVDGLNFKNEKVREKLRKITDSMAKQYAQELCYIFDVNSDYVKAALHRGVRNLSFKVINQINDIKFEDLI